MFFYNCCNRCHCNPCRCPRNCSDDKFLIVQTGMQGIGIKGPTGPAGPVEPGVYKADYGVYVVAPVAPVGPID